MATKATLVQYRDIRNLECVVCGRTLADEIEQERLGSAGHPSACQRNRGGCFYAVVTEPVVSQ